SFGWTALGVAVVPLAIDRCQARLKQHPDDVPAMVRLGCLLHRPGRGEEGGRWLVRAPQAARRDWATGHPLPTHHLCRAGHRLYGGTARPDTGGYDATRLRTDLQAAPADIRRQVEGHLREAAACYDWAVLFAPDDLEPYAARLQWTWSMPALALFE